MTTKNAVNTTLEIIGSEGMSGIKVTASSMNEACRKFGLKDLDDSQISRVITEIRRQNLAEITHTQKTFHFQLSVKGIHRLQRAQVERVMIAKPAAWDHLWRMVTYDVPRTQSAQRRLFARQLDRLGFTMIRESVWFHPYPCFEAVEEIVRYCGLQRHVTLAEISRIDNISLSKLTRAYPSLNSRHS